MTSIRNVTSTHAPIHTDVGGRVRVANMALVFEARFNYGDNPNLFTSFVENGGTVTYNQPYCGFDLAVGTAAGDRARRVSSRYISQPMGRSMVVQITGRFPESKPGVVSRVGWYDDENGAFFERNENGLFLVKRSSTSGSVVEERVAQADWNVDRLDGTGRSGVNLNLDTLQVVTFSTSFAGAGGIYGGFTIQQTPLIVHRFGASNNSVAPLIRPAALPIQCEIINEQATASPTSMFAEGVSAFVDGPYSSRELDSKRHYVSLGTTPVSVGTSEWTPIMSLSLSKIRENIEYRGNVILDEFQVLVVGTEPIMWESVVNATLAGPVSFNPPDTAPDSSLLVDFAATSYTGGRAMKSGFFNGGASNQAAGGATARKGDETPELVSRPFRDNDIITFAARALSSTAQAYLSISYIETED